MYWRRKVRPESHSGRPGAGDDGLGEVGPVRADLQAGQLRLRAERSGEQLGEGPLHGGRGARRRRPRRRPEGVRELRLPPG